MVREFKEGGFAYRRERIREAVFDPLIKAGMRKRRNQKTADLDAMIEGLCCDLAYLEPEWHEALRSIIERNAERSGKTVRDGRRPPKDIWPSAVAIRNWARDLSPLALVSELEGSYMRSAAGREAWCRGPTHAVVLASYLRRIGRPPSNDGAVDQIASDAADLHRRVAQARGLASDLSARAYVEKFERRAEEVRSLIFDDEPKSAGPEVWQ